MKIQHHPLVMEALEEHVERCVDPDHSGEDLSSCTELLSSLDRTKGEDERATCFAVENVTAERRGRVPEEDWSTLSLLDAAREALSSPPWRHPLKRSVIIEEALDLLEERGVPPETLVRDGLGDVLCRRIVLRLSAMWWHVRCAEGRESGVPPLVRAWSEVFDESADRLGSSPSLRDVVLESLGGAVGRRVAEMIATAPLEHVIGWRSSSPPALVEPRADAPALGWLVDRLIHTSPSSWRTTSLQWELAMSEDVKATAQAADISEAVLRERPACGDGALGELSRRVRERQAVPGSRKVEPTPHEVVGDLVEAIRGGQHLQAAALAESVLEAHPEDPALIQASAFCRIPTDPDQAWRMLQVVVPGSVRGNPFVLASLACVHLVKAEPVSARRLLGYIIETRCDPGARGWLWDPWDLLGRVQAPALHETTLEAWVTGALRAIDLLYPDTADQVTG